MGRDRERAALPDALVRTIRTSGSSYTALLQRMEAVIELRA